jgi:hypothetical protein
LGTEEPTLVKLVQRSRNQRRARERRLRPLLGGALLTGLVFALAAWFALVQRSEATIQTRLANEATRQADENAKAAGAAAQQTRVERDKSRSRLLAIQARRAADIATPDDIGRAGALASESIEITRTISRARLREA